MLYHDTPKKILSQEVWPGLFASPQLPPALTTLPKQLQPLQLQAMNLFVSSDAVLAVEGDDSVVIQSESFQART